MKTLTKHLPGIFLSALLGSTAYAAPLTWTDWTTATSSSANGTLGLVGVTYSGQVNVSATQTSGGTNFWGTNSAIYTLTGVENPPPASDIIAIDGGSSSTQTLTFSTPVVNPLLAVVSIGTMVPSSVQVDWNFNQPFVLRNSGDSYFTPFCCSVLLTQPGNVLRGTEGAGLIQLIGTYSSISWTVPAFENWQGFQVGYVDAQQPVPAVVYDNTTNVQGISGIGGGGTGEIGDQVTLAGTDRIVTEFVFGYTTAVSALDEIARVRFYANDGTDGAPSTMLYDSDQFLLPRGTALTYTLTGLLVPVPDTFTWTVEFSNGTGSDGYVMFAGPPTVGSSDPNFGWLNYGFGWLKSGPSFRNDDYMARITAVSLTYNDADGDGVGDTADNCKLVANAAQCDSDLDGYGNRCDGDMNQNSVTNNQDYGLFRAQLGQSSVAPKYNKADINCNGTVNNQDYGLFRGLLGAPPGPGAGP